MMSLGSELGLPSDTLAALQEFMAEKQEMDNRFIKLKENAEGDFEDRKEKLTMDLFQEDWQLSQFWYSEETADFIASRVLSHTTSDDMVAFISSPTAYVALKNMAPERRNVYVFEFDPRFDVFKSRFVFYDYNRPLELDGAGELRARFRFIVVDPPFLNEDCLSKTVETVRFLAAPGSKLMINTGAVMEKNVGDLVGARRTGFYPAHKGGLSNEYRCYTTFEDDKLKWA